VRARVCVRVCLPQELARAYPTAVAGELLGFKFDVDTSRFDMTYGVVACQTGDVCSTEVFVPWVQHYGGARGIGEAVDAGAVVTVMPVGCCSVAKTAAGLGIVVTDLSLQPGAIITLAVEVK
jgi:hypothetical protein